MKRRLLVAKAMVHKPPIIVLDEPTAALDPAATHSLEEIIDAIKKSGTKVIMSTHDLGQAQRLADEVLFLYRGRLLERADADHFFDQPENDLAKSFMRGELQTLGTWTAVMQASYQIHALVGLSAMACYFYAVQQIPLSNAVTLQYTAPLFVALFSGAMLRERVEHALTAGEN
jgi:ABC-type dipeptide/oligopeptide/nickel transport system ATPase component